MNQFFAFGQFSYLHGMDKDAFGYVASALVLATFSMKNMRSLRIVAILSNVAFIIFALKAGVRPVLVLHTILVPLNIWRLMQSLREEAQSKFHLITVPVANRIEETSD